ncbi:AMP-binding protein [Sphingorhabdus sp. SMR4y]|uniref:AMP-binding protein n=1 Tax=Sphingorhabdus sp. SMR4y TaxID=2584094 RepID=UPI000B5FCBC5|nr:AMP-binding protein [Sphingorhabdus sp. SMR4y]ASK87059.1 propionyl-CoA synthetase [Sphingorhabdus sp. SMR4y]
MHDYEKTIVASSADPDRFWLEASSEIDWIEAPGIGWDESSQSWFPDGQLNSCYNAVDRHVANGRADQIAVIYESPVTGQRQAFTYRELQAEVARTAGMIAAQGVGKGDRVIIYMPMIPQTMVAMLACARIGAIHSVVFGGFAPPELAKRIDDAEPRLLLTASCGIEGKKVIPYQPLVVESLALAKHRVPAVLLFQRETSRADIADGWAQDWSEQLAKAGSADCVPLKSSDPLYILYTSGTTGTPKGVVRDNGGHAVALNWSMKNIYGLMPGECFWAASDVGWVVGHSYIVYGPLFAGATVVLYEGKPVGTPDAGEFWRVIERNQVAVFFTAPTAIRAIRKEDENGEYYPASGLPSLRAIFLAGERADPDTIKWLEQQSGRPVIDHWWQTELGWPALATCMGLGDDRRKAGSAGFPVPGYQFHVLNDNGESVSDEKVGNISIKCPLPPGCYQSLWGNEEGYRKAFASYPGYYETGDAGFRDADGFMHVMGRTDDIINVAGHRLSTGQMEGALAEIDGVAECAVIGADDPLKGMIPVAFVVTSGQQAASELVSACIAHVRSEIGAVASVKTIHVVAALPKTRSGKILRSTLRAIANDQAVTTPNTIENPEAIDAILSKVRTTDR